MKVDEGKDYARSTPPMDGRPAAGLPTPRRQLPLPCSPRAFCDLKLGPFHRRSTSWSCSGPLSLATCASRGQGRILNPRLPLRAPPFPYPTKPVPRWHFFSSFKSAMAWSAFFPPACVPPPTSLSIVALVFAKPAVCHLFERVPSFLCAMCTLSQSLSLLHFTSLYLPADSLGGSLDIQPVVSCESWFTIGCALYKYVHDALYTII
jgi:hypothetical protein